MGPPARFLVMRHGESEANVAGLVCSDPEVGIPRYGLTARGREQVRARCEGEALLREVTRIHASDFRRARETAELVGELRGVAAPLVLEPDLRERFFGVFEGKDSASYDEVWRRDRETPGDPGDGIEPVSRVLARAGGLVRRLAGAHPGETVLLVCHGDVAQILLAASHGHPPHAHRDVPHLETAGVRELGPALLG